MSILGGEGGIDPRVGNPWTIRLYARLWGKIVIDYIRKTARVSQRVYPYVYIMFNDELTIAMVMVIRYYGNDPFHGNSSTRWKEDVEPVVT